MGIIKKVYLASPYPLQQMAKWAYSFIPLKIRYGKDFFDKLAWLEESQWWSEAEMENYQNEQLRKLINHACRNVPYYSRLFKKIGITPSDIKTIEDLPKIPLLTKEDVRNNFDGLVATNYHKKDLVYLTTSGTTGQPIGFYSERRLEYIGGDPFLWRYYRWGGCDLINTKATLTEWILKPTINKKRRIFSYNPVQRLLILSTYDLRLENVDQYARALSRYQPDFLKGFPSALEILIKYLKQSGIPRPVNPRAVFTNSEVVYPWQRELIEDYFGCEIFDWYALEERVINACECEKHAGYHIFSDYSIVEFIKDGRPVSGEEEAEIVATRFGNYAMPLIRYRTGDMGIPLKEKCGCGRGLPLMKLVGGRKRNFVITKSGGLIPVTIVDIPQATENVEQFQFLQEKKGYLILKIVKKDEFGNKDLKQVHKKLKEKLGEEMEVKIEFVDEIPRTKGGKLPLLIQHLNIEER